MAILAPNHSSMMSRSRSNGLINTTQPKLRRNAYYSHISGLMAAGFGGSIPWYVFVITILLLVLLGTISNRPYNEAAKTKEVVPVRRCIVLFLIATSNVVSGITCSAVASTLLPQAHF